MLTFVTASKSFAEKNVMTDCEKYFFPFGRGFISSNYPICTLPKTPWMLTDQFQIYTDGTQRLVISNTSQSLRYFAADDTLAMMPIKYIQNSNNYEYEHCDKAEVSAMLEAEVTETSGEYLGELEVASRFWRILKLMIKKGSDSKLKKRQLDAVRKDMAIVFLARDEGGVGLQFRINTKSQSEYGGLSEAEFVDGTGELRSNVSIGIKYEQYSSLYKLARFGRSGASVRITRSMTNPEEAVLVWSSPVWDGTVLTKAEIISL